MLHTRMATDADTPGVGAAHKLNTCHKWPMLEWYARAPVRDYAQVNIPLFSKDKRTEEPITPVVRAANHHTAVNAVVDSFTCRLRK